MADRRRAVADIRERLSEHAEELAAELLPDGRRVGNEWQSHSKTSPIGERIDVVISGSKVGMVAFWNRPKQGGDLLDLIQAVESLDFKGAMQWATRYLGIDDAPIAGRKDENRSTDAQRKRLQKEQEVVRDREDRKRSAFKIWQEGEPLRGTSGERYLRNRGIDSGLDIPALRFHRGLEYPRTVGEPRRTRPTYPAIIGVICGPDRKFRGVQRLFITPDGDKAPESNPKVSLGPILGGASYLWKGDSEHIGVGEGIETMLAVRGLTRGVHGIAACLSTAGLAGWLPPTWIRKVTIFPDGDVDKIRPQANGNEKVIQSPGLVAAGQLKYRLDVLGIECIIQPTPKSGRDYLDVWNAAKEHMTGE